MSIYFVTTHSDYEEIKNFIRQPFSNIIFLDDFYSAKDVFEITSSDEVVLTLADESQSGIIKSYLIQKGLPDDSILDFFKIFNSLLPLMNADKVSKNPLFKSYDAVILGISHAEVGIIAENLPFNAANLSVSSQDIFYNIATYKYVLEKYPDKYRNLKYIIFDMYKYNYFNYDTSLSNMLSNYLIWGGYNIDRHNFDRKYNSLAWDGLLNYIYKYHYDNISNKSIDKFSEFFNINQYYLYTSKYNKSIKTRTHVITDNDVENYQYNPSNVRKHFEDTIKENIEIFNNFLTLVSRNNPDVKVILLLLPWYKDSWILAQKYYGPWKNEFENIIKNIQYNHSNVVYHDYTECDGISDNRLFWYDSEHLNYLGALAFTEMLNDSLFNV